MAYALIAHTTSTAGSASAGVNTTGANFLVGCVSALSPPGTPTDSKGNTWHALHEQAADAGGTTQIFYAYNATVGSGHTFTANGSFPSGCFLAFSGALITDPFDVESVGSNDAGNPFPGSITPAQDNSLIILTVGVIESSAPTADSGFTVLDFVAVSGGVNYSSASAYLIQTSAAAVNPLVTHYGGMYQAAFKPAGGGVTFLSRLPLLGAG